MVSKFESDNKSSTNSSIMIFVVSLLLFVSIAVSLYGLMNGKNEKEAAGDVENINPEESKSESQDDALTEMFQKEFSEKRSSDETYFNDPFRETCSSAGSGDVPMISSYTVCYR